MVRTYIAPDTIDYTRYKTGKDCSGIFYSLQSFINKAIGGITGSVALYILAACGWQEVQGESFADLAAQGVTQSEAALDALWNLGYLIPAIGFAIAAVLLYAFYNLTDKDAALMAQCNAGLLPVRNAKHSCPRNTKNCYVYGSEITRTPDDTD